MNENLKFSKLGEYSEVRDNSEFRNNNENEKYNNSVEFIDESNKNKVETESKNKVERENKNEVETENKNKVETESKNKVERENKNEVETENKNKVETENKNDIRPNSWMVRPCKLYSDEYKECVSIKGRFHQYFIFGENIDCSQWKIDFENCNKWNEKEDPEAFDAIVASETSRRINRLKGHYANDVWKKRVKPPEDWDKPLPEWMQKRNENSYLEMKNQQIKTGTVNDFETKIPMCSIL